MVKLETTKAYWIVDTTIGEWIPTLYLCMHKRDNGFIVFRNMDDFSIKIIHKNSFKNGLFRILRSGRYPWGTKEE